MRGFPARFPRRGAFRRRDRGREAGRDPSAGRARRVESKNAATSPGRSAPPPSWRVSSPAGARIARYARGASAMSEEPDLQLVEAYRAGSGAVAHLLVAALEAEGIAAFVDGDPIQGSAG